MPPLTKRRHSVRTIASLIRRVWSARNVTFKAVNSTAKARSPPSTRKCAEICAPGRREGMAEMTGMNSGTINVASANRSPHQRGVDRQGPAQSQAKDGGRRRKGSAQIVDHLPTTDLRNFVIDVRGSVAPAGKAENPWQELPVASRPAVMTLSADVVSRREFFDDFDIRREALRAKVPSNRSWLSRVGPERGRRERSRTRRDRRCPSRHKTLRRTCPGRRPKPC